MLYAISMDYKFWQERLNGVVLLAPVTRFDHTQVSLFWAASEIQNEITSKLDEEFIWNIFNPSSPMNTKWFCRDFATLCKMGEGFTFSQKEASFYENQDSK